jgi:hypothetical protein
MSFIDDLSLAIEQGDTATSSNAKQSVIAFLDASQLQKLEATAPGWSDSIDHDKAETFTHVVLAMASLKFHREFEESSPNERNAIRWALLFHDIAKRSREVQDSTHAFRSAVVMARSLPLIGVELPTGYSQHIHGWAELTLGAVTQPAGRDVPIQDNQRIPEILAGLDLMLENHTCAKTAIKLVLLHHSINHLQDWPQASALTESQVSQLFDSRLLQLIRVMMLADSDGWELFNTPNCTRYREETRTVFRRLQSLVASN